MQRRRPKVRRHAKRAAPILHWRGWIVVSLILLLGAIATCHATRPPSATIPPEPPSSGAIASAATMRIHLINVGQGAATLVEFSCAAILIDTGGESNAGFESTEHLMRYLDAFFKGRPDLHETLAELVLTHPHIDHTRNAMEVWKRYHVANVVTDGMTISSGGKQEEALLEAADAAHIGDDKVNEHDIPREGLHDAVIDPVACSDGDPDIRVFWGSVTESDVIWGERALKNANNDSVVVKISLGRSSFLITGDLEQDGIAALVDRYRGTNALDADVYEVGHHGSYNGTTQALLDAITPKVALISMGLPDRQETWSAWAYGHPRKVTIDLLEHALTGEKRAAITVPIATGAKEFEQHELTAPIYATGWDGNVVLELEANGRVSVETESRR